MSTVPIHLNTLIHNIILILKKSEEGLTFDKLKSLLHIDVLASPELLSRLRSNPRIIFTDVRLQYRPKFSIKSAEELLGKLASKPSDPGIPLSELRESYKSIEVDLTTNSQFAENVILVVSGDNTFIFHNSDPATRPAPEGIQCFFINFNVRRRKGFVE